MILPGVELGLSALSSNTALLPQISPQNKTPLIGKNTEECMLSGALRGAGLLVDSAVSEMWLQLGERGSLVITGGCAGYVEPHLKSTLIHCPNLIMDGMFIIKDRIRHKDKEE